MNVKSMTIDQLLELLNWIVARQNYRRVCGICDGVAYAEECKVESDAIYELQCRGYYNK